VSRIEQKIKALTTTKPQSLDTECEWTLH